MGGKTDIQKIICALKDEEIDIPTKGHSIF